MQTIIQFFIENIRLIVQFKIVSFDHVLNPIITIIISQSIMRIFVITLYFWIEYIEHVLVVEGEEFVG